MEYKYETHCHTSQVSRCADISPEDTVRLYDKLGYSGLVLTEHYSPSTFRYTMLTPHHHLKHYLSSYRAMKKFAGDSFDIIPGMELRYYFTINDYLIYGPDEKWIEAQGNMLPWYPEKTHEIAKKEGFIVLQAHPFRAWMSRCNPDFIDGVEVYNGKNNAEDNEKATVWADETGKIIRLSGSDCHKKSQAGKGGIITEKRIKNPAELVSIIKGGEFKLITP